MARRRVAALGQVAATRVGRCATMRRWRVFRAWRH